MAPRSSRALKHVMSVVVRNLDVPSFGGRQLRHCYAELLSEGGGTLLYRSDVVESTLNATWRVRLPEEALLNDRSGGGGPATTCFVLPVFARGVAAARLSAARCSTVACEPTLLC